MIALMSIQIIYYTIQLLKDFSNFKILITEYFSFTLGFVIHFYIILVFATFLLVIKQRFQVVNKTLKNFDNIQLLKKGRRVHVKNNHEVFSTKTSTTSNSLDILAELHYKLCECAETLNRTYTVPLFFCVHILYGEMVYVAYTYKFMYDSILEDYHFTLSCVCFTVNMIALLICTYVTEIEVIPR